MRSAGADHCSAERLERRRRGFLGCLEVLTVGGALERFAAVNEPIDEGDGAGRMGEDLLVEGVRLDDDGRVTRGARWGPKRLVARRGQRHCGRARGGWHPGAPQRCPARAVAHPSQQAVAALAAVHQRSRDEQAKRSAAIRQSPLEQDHQRLEPPTCDRSIVAGMLNHRR